jgi:hypothetical protein
LAQAPEVEQRRALLLWWLAQPALLPDQHSLRMCESFDSIVFSKDQDLLRSPKLRSCVNFTVALLHTRTAG